MSFENAHADDLRQVRDVARALAERSYDQARGVPLKAWTALAARRAAINYTRAWNRSQSYGAGVMVMPLSGLESIQPSVAEPFLDQAICKLALPQQELIRLIYWEGLLRQEIADLWNVSIRTIGVRSARALKNLRSILCPNSHCPSC